MLIVADSRGFFRAGEQGAAAFAESSLPACVVKSSRFVRSEICVIALSMSVLMALVAFVDGLLQPEGIHAQRDASDLLGWHRMRGRRR